MTVLLVISAFFSVRLGTRDSSFSELLSALFYPDQMDSFTAAVIQKRLPRTVFSILAGGGLAVSGALVQSVTRNPIADPGILGINMGASLAVVIGISFFGLSSYMSYIVFGLLGAFMTALLVYRIGSIGVSGATPVKLALAGMVISIAFSSFINCLVLPQQHVMDQFRFWQVGGVGRATFPAIVSLLPFLVAGFLLALFLASSLNILELGDQIAESLGVSIQTIRLLSAVASVLLCGSITAIGGPISFVGLIIPHLIRMIFDVDMLFLIPTSALSGGVLLTWCDILGRIIAPPSEIEVGILTAIIGAPLLIFFTLRNDGGRKK